MVATSRIGMIEHDAAGRQWISGASLISILSPPHGRRHPDKRNQEWGRPQPPKDPGMPRRKVVMKQHDRQSCWCGTAEQSSRSWYVPSWRHTVRNVSHQGAVGVTDLFDQAWKFPKMGSKLGDSTFAHLWCVGSNRALTSRSLCTAVRRNLWGSGPWRCSSMLGGDS